MCIPNLRTVDLNPSFAKQDNTEEIIEPETPPKKAYVEVGRSGVGHWIFAIIEADMSNV